MFGGGSRDRDLDRADQLIKEMHYEEAIMVLIDLARRDPNQFDNVQKRLNKILQIQDEFNRTADELIDTIMHDPENNDKILALSSHLYTLEHSESPLMTSFVTRTRELAQFNVNRNLLRSIMERGRRHLDNGESYEALLVYSEGLGFLRNEFFELGLAADVYDDVRRETENINSIIAAFRQTGDPLSVYSAQAVNALNSGEPADIYLAAEELIPVMDSFIAAKQSLYASMDVIDRILNDIRISDPDMGDRNHLTFVSVLIHGREESAQISSSLSTATSGQFIQEGILGAFDTHWQFTAGKIADTAASLVDKSRNDSISALNAENYSVIPSFQERNGSYTDVYMMLLGKNIDLFAGENPQTVTLYEKYILQKDIKPLVEITAMNEANRLLVQAAQVGLQREINNSVLNTQNENITAAQMYTGEQQTRAAIYVLRRELEAIAADGIRINDDLNRHSGVTQITQALAAIDNMNMLLSAEIRMSGERFYTAAKTILENAVAERRVQLERSRAFLDGINYLDGDGLVAVYRYPSDALTELTAMNAEAAIDLQNANNVTAQYRNEPQEILSSAEVTAMLSSYQVLVTELTAIRAQGLTLVETARSRASQAEAYRQEGERLFREAQLAYQRQDYDTAWDRIERASGRFSASLEIQESAAIREMRDTQLIGLGITVAQAQNEMIIAEVRSLVDSARNSYFNGNFQQAEDSLLRARNRWRITNPSGENDEVVYWLGIVRTALSASSGRVISPTAPLYMEMSQLLSQAQRNYEEGMRFINSGQRPMGLAKFDEARQLIQEVKLIYPLNQEAGLLDLRIDQFIDPVAFNTSFEQRLQAAVTGTRQRSIEAFADLQNLAEINPRYPNIRNIITQAEIDMGFRPPPPNPASLARSSELTTSARRILDTNQTAQYQVALMQLNEAITLNPDNAEAGRVRDLLLSRMSVPGTIVLTSDDEEVYQRALRELNAGNYLVAFALAERLMQNQRNRNVQKVIELHQRIQTYL
ncbi:MAG: hypothetical protein FWC17_01900 [Treponema sp.]|nr:hypothetical protein [Treponema sp.]